MRKKDNSYILVYVTTDSEIEAIKLTKLVLNNKLAACSNIINGSKSFYWWNNEINESKECIIFFKTNLKNEEKLIEKVIKNHSYDNPCVISIPILKGNETFLSWIDKETKLN
ncbi:MAG: Divalent-cation tolerance protein CutA [Alphaproteobacteria bacterium MarineAlpha2_Bin1]|nr:MAG: Divalent-cation tolerance protein CutA [Alphaproteobacteria bacterium MarineAlpha2_Bin1]